MTLMIRRESGGEGHAVVGYLVTSLLLVLFYDLFYDIKLRNPKKIRISSTILERDKLKLIPRQPSTLFRRLQRLSTDLSVGPHNSDERKSSLEQAEKTRLRRFCSFQSRFSRRDVLRWITYKHAHICDLQGKSDLAIPLSC